MEAKTDSTSSRFGWGVAVIVVTAAGLAGVAHSVITDPTGDVTFSRARPVSVNDAADGLGLPAVPGGTVVAPITASNPGADPLRYAVVSTLTRDTATVGYMLTIKAGVTACPATGFDGPGTVAYIGPLGSTVGLKIIGDSAHGQQPGDRPLDAGASDVLCTQVTMPVNTANIAAGLALETEQLTVNAEPTG